MCGDAQSLKRLKMRPDRPRKVNFTLIIRDHDSGEISDFDVIQEVLMLLDVQPNKSIGAGLLRHAGEYGTEVPARIAPFRTKANDVQAHFDPGASTGARLASGEPFSILSCGLSRIGIREPEMIGLTAPVSVGRNKQQQ